MNSIRTAFLSQMETAIRAGDLPRVREILAANKEYDRLYPAGTVQPIAPIPQMTAQPTASQPSHLTMEQRHTAIRRIPQGTLTIYVKQKGQPTNIHIGTLDCATLKVTATNNIIYPTINKFATCEAGQRVDVWASKAVYVMNGGCQTLDAYLRQFL